MNTFKQFTKKPLFVAMSGLLLGLNTYNLQAEENEPVADDLEVIQVIASGYADSLAKALATKKLSSGSVDTILAEDIADFPDQNLADSLQRIPGIAIDRDAGEGRGITVRGLNSTFTRVQLNGMEAQSLSAGSGGVQTNRGFDFNVFASELFNQLTVYKTTSAKLDEGSLGATVGLRTARPFDFKENVAAINYQQSYNDLSEKSTPRASGLFSFTNEDSSFGGLVSLAYSERNISDIGPSTGRWEDDRFGRCSACVTEADEDAVANAWHPRFPRDADITHDQKRTGLTASLQWIPTDSTLVTFDALRANIKSDRAEPFMEAISLSRTGSNGIPQTDVTAYTIDANNSLITATMADVDIRSENFVANWESDFSQYSINVEQEITSDLKANILLGTSKSEMDNRETTVILDHWGQNDSGRYLDYPESASTISYDFTNMLAPTVSYGFDTANPANWELSEFRDRIYVGSSDSDTAKVDFEYILNDEITMLFGINSKGYGYELAGTRADRSFSSADTLNGGAKDGIACGISNVVTASDGKVVTFGGQTFFQGNASDADINRFASSGCWPAGVRAGDTRKVQEDSLGYYVQADFNYEVAGKVLRGNLGVRSVKTDLSSTGLQSGNTEVTVKNDYRDTLPALNLAYEVSEDVILRAGLAKVMSRPNLSDLNPGGSVTIFGDPKVSYGNPFIDPFRAKTIDVSAEWYFEEGALLSLAYFKKKIESFPESQTTTLLWKDTGLPNSLLGSQLNDLVDAEFQVTRTVNGDTGGDLDGFEIQYQQQLTMLPGPDWMKKFGIIANMTFVDSEVNYGADRVGPLTGQSDTSSNFTLYWEDEVFSARVSVANRGEYFSDLSGSDERKWRTVDASRNVDMSASYQISENIKIKFDAINVTDEPVVQYMDPAVNRLIQSNSTGRQYFVGISYKM